MVIKKDNRIVYGKNHAIVRTRKYLIDDVMKVINLMDRKGYFHYQYYYYDQWNYLFFRKKVFNHHKEVKKNEFSKKRK